MEQNTNDLMQERMKALERVRRRLVIDVNELANLISFTTEDLPKADTMSRAMVMRLLNVKNDYKFARICMRAGLPYNAGTRYTRVEYLELARMDEVFDMLFALPDDKVERLKELIREVFQGVD
ncbi:MAG: hypothetical protein IJ654_10445 [Bacteroidales bacterium]|nr:hypothetical protein [Bacteroidales bacterium]